MTATQNTVSRPGTDPGDTLVQQVVSGIDAGVEVEDYLAAVDAGICHEEIMVAHDAHLLFSEYIDCRRLGATAAEVTEISKLGVSANAYRRALMIGVPHFALRDLARVLHERQDRYPASNAVHDFLDGCEAGIFTGDLVNAVKAGLPLTTYVKCRKKGASHTEICEACVRGGLSVFDYHELVEAGISHAEALLVKALGISSMYYAGARKHGASYDQICEAIATGVYLPDYSRCIEVGATHSQICEASRAGIVDLRMYMHGFANGVDHREMVEAGVDEYLFAKYVDMRVAGHTRDDVLCALGIM